MDMMFNKKLAAVTVSLATAGILAGCGSGPAANPTPTGSSAGLTAGDAAALIGAGSVLQQIPQATGKERQDFVDKIKASQSGKGDLDTGVEGVTVSSYSISVDDAAAPACVTAAPPADSGATKPTMAVYFQPGAGQGQSGYLVAGPDIIDCQKGQEAYQAAVAQNVSSAEVTKASMAFFMQAYASLPFSALSKPAISLFDQIRVTLNATAQPTAPASAQPTVPAEQPSAPPAEQSAEQPSAPPAEATPQPAETSPQP